MAGLLLDHAADASPSLRKPTEGIMALEVKLNGARGEERRYVQRELALAHMFAAEEILERRATRRHRRDANRFAGYASKKADESYLRAEMAFVRLWNSWRAGRKTAGKQAARYTERHRGAGDLPVIAWMVRGDVDYEARRWAKAERSFRYVVAIVDHPLYGLALYRTAQCYLQLGRDDDSREAFLEVVDLGCATGQRNVQDEVLISAAAETGSQLVRTADDRLYPSKCAPRPKED